MRLKQLDWLLKNGNRWSIVNMQFYALIRDITNLKEMCVSVNEASMTCIDCPCLAISYPEILFSTTASYFLGSSYVYTSSAADALFKKYMDNKHPYSSLSLSLRCSFIHGVQLHLPLFDEAS